MTKNGTGREWSGNIQPRNYAGPPTGTDHMDLLSPETRKRAERYAAVKRQQIGWDAFTEDTAAETVLAERDPDWVRGYRLALEGQPRPEQDMVALPRIRRANRAKDLGH